MFLLATWAWAQTGHVIIEAVDSQNCTLSVDGADYGKLPVHAYKMPGGSHQFDISCPDGRKASTRAEVKVLPAPAFAHLVLENLTYSAPTPEKVTGPIPAYVLLSQIGGQKVRIDGGPPVALPARVSLTVGPHSFVVVEPNGTERPAVSREVVSVGGQAVVKLD